MTLPQRGLIICGTDTDVGKTVISSLFVQGLNAIYWKPIQSGLDSGSDTKYIRQLLNRKDNNFIEESYKFKAPVSPHWAAEKENQLIDEVKLKIPIVNKTIIIETAGGLLVPINRQTLQIDIIKEWNLPVVLVARSGLGTINHTLLSIEALRAKDIAIKGIILNGALHEDNPQTIKEFSQVPILAEIPRFKNLSAESLSQAWYQQKLNVTFKDFTHNHI
tara:strand:- start:105 stop:761 length:657 start_codon:yes stop_codon:yes gene_type:complete